MGVSLPTPKYLSEVAIKELEQRENFNKIQAQPFIVNFEQAFYQQLLKLWLLWK